VIIRADRQKRRVVAEATKTTPTIVPMIAYEDTAAALAWLARAFGFRECHPPLDVRQPL
jgi:hypothetical protein